MANDTLLDASPASPDSRGQRSAPWLAWLLGVALLVVVVAAALHFSEGRSFVSLAERAEPQWLLLAVVLQAATYLAQSRILCLVGRAGGFALPLGVAYELSLAKLFLDQALPSAGFGGTIVAAHALEQRGMMRTTVMASVVITTVSFYVAYVVCLAAALGITVARHQANTLILLTSVLFVVFGIALSAALLGLSGQEDRLPARLVRRRLGRVLQYVAMADPRLARSVPLLFRSSLYQLAIFICDAATMWTLVRALGIEASPSGIFASFMIASLFRTIGVLPGGLGSFEAASVLTLTLVGIGVPAALSATLLFRGFSFWLPMLPGLWCARRVTKANTPRAGDRAGIEDYGSLGIEELLLRLNGGADGLSSAAAAARLLRHGPNTLATERAHSVLTMLLRQLRNPLLLLLFFAATVALFAGEWADAGIVLVIAFASIGITVKREYGAQNAAAALRARVRTRARALRDGAEQSVALEDLVPGDVVLLSAGSLVPGDGVIIEATDFYVSEAALTGESFPVEKRPGRSPAGASLAKRTNCVFLGTNVRSGSARCLIVATGAATEFGSIAARLELRPADTEFDAGIRRFGYLLTSTMLVIVLLVFVVHVLLHRPPIETLLFAVALAVGLSPELLPAILSVNLARGAQMMARQGVLVRRLNAIENLGSMDVLCTDKTGTLTEGVVEVEGAYDAAGEPSDAVLELAAINAMLETGLTNPLDDAILQRRRPVPQPRKLAEIPFDFVRKRVSVVIAPSPGSARLVSKGAFHHVLDVCARLVDGTALDAAGRTRLERQYERWCSEGIRVIAVATRTLEERPGYGRDDEHDLEFAGFVTFLDRPQEGVSEAITALNRLGVTIKLITGDSRLVAQHVANLVGMRAEQMLTGPQLDELHDEALWREAERTDIFAEVDPNQKERIILALKKMGHVVGFLGDGVNDAPAMHASDTSLSVAQAVDVAREAADFVLLERSLDVIRRGIEEGRRTFANTLKYILITTSANVGNMLSMAAASLFLPFLPLLAGQILLNNFLSDIPAVGLADDTVNPELVERPRRWDMRFIGRFMLEFGVLSSAFDFLTFAVLLLAFDAGVELFRTGWFTESLLTELVIALVVRTRRPCFRSRPGTLLLASTLVLIALTAVIPFLPFAGLLGFVPLPMSLCVVLVAITVLYVVAAELAKTWFYRHAP